MQTLLIRRIVLVAAALGGALPPAPARARPTAPGVICAKLPTTADCAGGVPACTLCHDSTDPPAWNAFGTALKAMTSGRPDFDAALAAALVAIAEVDSDGDGQSNGAELMRGSAPGRADAKLPGETPGGQNPRFNLAGYDARFAFRRAMVLYCGRSPTYAQAQAIAAMDPAAAGKQLHAQLSTCLQSDYWQKEGLPRLADKRIKPLKAAGPDTNIMISGKRLVIGDYHYDYRLWRYILSDDHDMRELLTARYHVVEGADGKLMQVSGTIEKTNDLDIAGGQAVDDEHRAGMLTTQWFLALNTMFTALPRTTAAQAYRSYLGTDIAMNQGLRPVEGEPLDIDNRGVKQARCANCHSTLDPLSYAFAEYDGINPGKAFGGYNPERVTQVLPGWDASKQKSVLLGQPVKTLVEWGQVAARSDEFKRNMALIFYRHALGREPTAADQEEFQKLWKSISEDGYSANKLIHRLVDTMTFGGP